MRDTFRDVCLVLGVILAGIQVIQGIKHPEKIGAATPWIVIVSLFTVSALLFIVGIHKSTKSREPAAPPTLDSFTNPTWEIVSNHKFVNESIEVDGKSFRNCAFHNVTFLFHGSAPTEFAPGKNSFSGSIVLTTDHLPTVAWGTLQHMFAQIPGAKVGIPAPFDEKGHLVKRELQGSFAQPEIIATSPNPLRLRVRELSQELFDFLREVGPAPEVKRRNKDEEIEDYLRHAYQVTGPRIKALHHGYEARGLGDRVNKMYHELEAAGVQHELKPNNLVSQVQNEDNIRTIAEALFRTAANMEMQDVAKGSKTQK